MDKHYIYNTNPFWQVIDDRLLLKFQEKFIVSKFIWLYSLISLLKFHFKSGTYTERIQEIKMFSSPYSVNIACQNAYEKKKKTQQNTFKQSIWRSS